MSRRGARARRAQRGGAAWLIALTLTLARCAREDPTHVEPASPAPSPESSAQATPPEAKPAPALAPAALGPAHDPAAHLAAHQAIARRQLRGELLEASALVHDTPIESRDRLASFFAALAALERGETDKLRVLVYGSSNIAGDRFTGYLRGYLQARYGDGGPGFVALVPLWKWHRHQEVRVEASRGWTPAHALRPEDRGDSRYGLMGVRATSSAGRARLSLELRGLGSEAVERWELWFDGGAGRGSFELRFGEADAQLVDTSTPGLGYVSSTSARGSTLALETRGDGPVRLFGAVLERPRGVVVDELGIGGSGARRWLDWDEGVWAEHVQRRAPALVILAYGGIESMRSDHDPGRFAEELELILARVETAAPQASCLLIGPQDRAHRQADGARRRPETLDGIIATLRAAALGHGCAFFDTQAMMGGPGTMPAWVEAELAQADHVHFTPRGYAHMGRVFVDALIAPRGPDRVGPHK